MDVLYSRQALRDLQSIGDYIALDSPKRSLTFVAELRQACHSLAIESLLYPILQPPKGYRRMPVGNYLVFYLVTDESVRIVRVVHSARDMRNLSLG